MKKIILVAETGSDISPEEASKYGIVLIPMHISFGDRTVDDGIFLAEEVVKYYEETGQLSKTSGCVPSDVEKVFDLIHSKCQKTKILYLAYSGVTTCSYQSACIAAEGRDYVKLIDTKSVSAGQYAIVTRIAQLLDENSDWTMEKATKETECLIHRVKMCFIPQNMDFLRAGGRVSNAVALCGNILGIHPQIDIVDGYLKATKKWRGKIEKVVQKMIVEFSEQAVLSKDEVWFLYAPRFPETIRKIVEQKAKDFGFRKINWVKTGGVITTHSGPGAFGIAGFSENHSY